ncbi:ethanolamine permease [Desulfovibrio subterraneus]|jgi:ethanolamine permease|uniref:Ethanolamine permease n=1 Tax=Desulfovibrio subterraneus TaxID=2718620 RepID=A0A7J0BMD8_9BACT|nr:ethanolamine permease [Desulfovibrio subterraneus]WBF66409.1 ethanolamine permease [Desulfovibrio subterraneus]GFM34748.1 ethanolamine permease [Desulfovibrio subterraneus]
MSHAAESQQLERKLGPWMLWGLGVGYVISGMYFGWNLGLEQGGTLGLGVATLFIILMYLTFTFSYTELACAIPRAGGAFDYATKALGTDLGFLAGMAQVIEFVFAPPAIAAAIGAYFNLFLPDVPTLEIAIVAYILFTALNIYGVQAAASFELFITILAVVELLIFAGVTAPAFQWENLTHNALPHGWGGAFAAIPFAIWFFLAIEGVANVAEEAINPQRNILIGFGAAIVTLVVLAIITFLSSVGVAGWEAIVYPAAGAAASDSPLPLALGKLVGDSHLLYHLLIFIGLFGLVASFHGIILAAGRAVLEMGRAGFVPRTLGAVSPKFRTPANALMANMVIGIIALFTGKTGEIITIAVFGALTLYIVSLISLFVLRKKAPGMTRPFKVPFYPLSPAIGLVIACVAMVAVCYYNAMLAAIYAGIMVFSFFYYKVSTYHESVGDQPFFAQLLEEV